GVETPQNLSRARAGISICPHQHDHDRIRFCGEKCAPQYRRALFAARFLADHASSVRGYSTEEGAARGSRDLAKPGHGSTRPKNSGRARQCAVVTAIRKKIS